MKRVNNKRDKSVITNEDHQHVVVNKSAQPQGKGYDKPHKENESGQVGEDEEESE